jgi:hypothetical protein
MKGIVEIEAVVGNAVASHPEVVAVSLLDRDPSFRIRFEIRARHEFFDIQPVLDRYRRQRRDKVPRS